MAIDNDAAINVEALPDDMQVLQKLVRRMETEMAELESRLNELTLDEAAAEAYDQTLQTTTPVKSARTVGVTNMLA
jgi:phage shock protein A